MGNDLFLAPGVSSNPLMSGLVGQFARKVAYHIEKGFCHSEALDGSCTFPFRFEPPKDDGGWQHRQIDNLCASYVALNKAATADARHMSFGIDKVNSHGLQLMNGAAVLSSNV